MTFSDQRRDNLSRIGAGRNFPGEFRRRLLSSSSWYAISFLWRRL